VFSLFSFRMDGVDDLVLQLERINTPEERLVGASHLAMPSQTYTRQSPHVSA